MAPPDRNFLDRLNRELARRRFLAGAAAGAAGIIAFACTSGGNGDDTATPGPTSASTPDPNATRDPNAVVPSLLTTEFVASQNNRFLIGLLDGSRKLVRGANVHLKFYKLGGDNLTGSLRGEGDMQYIELKAEGAHAHDSSTGEATELDVVGFYAANVPFQEPGGWGVEVEVTPTDGSDPTKIQVPFEVLAEYKTPANGAVPPASVNDTVTTTANLESLCSRDPQCDLHDKVIADVLGKGRPLVVLFSTPKYCASRFCGPVLEVLLEEVPNYRDRIDFVHIEVWEDFATNKPRPAVQEWKLPTEPYAFFMDGEGRVVGRLEAIFSNEELVAKLNGLVSA